ncbi:MAG: NAD(P)-dependent oxidoreductase, partial [Pseudomonadales bacterium]|nr:NAD(P)-dependent oxidoreductase [Pseudomonadales bacterium]
MMKTVLVTGGLGNIGIKIIDELLSRGIEVRCLDLKTKANLKTAKRYYKRAKLIWGDITDYRCVISAVMDVDAVIHTAAILPPFSEQNPDIARKVNVGGTRNVLDALTQFNPDAHLVMASSVSVHGNHLPNQHAIRAVTDPLNPIDYYAQHKIECEQMLRNIDLKWTVLRISACVDEKARVLSIKNLRGSIDTFLKVDPQCRIEYIHPADVATAMVNAVGNEQAIGKAF